MPGVLYGAQGIVGYMGATPIVSMCQQVTHPCLNSQVKPPVGICRIVNVALTLVTVLAKEYTQSWHSGGSY